MNNGIHAYSTEPQSGEGSIFHLALTLRGTTVLVFAQTVNKYGESQF